MNNLGHANIHFFAKFTFNDLIGLLVGELIKNFFVILSAIRLVEGEIIFDVLCND